MSLFKCVKSVLSSSFMLILLTSCASFNERAFRSDSGSLFMYYIRGHIGSQVSSLSENYKVEA